MAKDKTQTKENHENVRKTHEGIPCNEQSYKDWQKAFTDIEECIKGLK